MIGWKAETFKLSLRKTIKRELDQHGLKWLKGILIYGVYAWALLGNGIYVLIWLPACAAYVNRKKREETQLKKRQILYEFIDFLEYFNVSVMAGYSMENSIVAYSQKTKSEHEMHDQGQFFGALIKATKRMCLGGNINIFLNEMATRFEANEIKFFSMCLNTAITTGGDLKEIVYESCCQIKQKINMEQEIEALVAEKKLEVTIMSIMPYVVLWMMKCTMNDVVAPLLNTWQGSLGLFVLFLYFESARMLGDALVDIRV